MLGRARWGAAPAALVVLPGVFLFGSRSTEPAVIRGTALLSVMAVVLRDAGAADLGYESAAGLAEAVLIALDGFEHGLAGPGVLVAEAQAIQAGASRWSRIEYIMRYSAGGREKFRRTPVRPGEGEDFTPYFVHFQTDLWLPRD